MKIHFTRKQKARPHSFIFVTCLDALMAENLAWTPDTYPSLSPEQIALRRLHGDISPVYMFWSGAVLAIQPGVTNRWTIQGFHPDGNDSMAAMEQLKMLDTVRQAGKFFTDMKMAYGYPQDHIQIRLTHIPLPPRY